jgi:hypothetical protein
VADDDVFYCTVVFIAVTVIAITVLGSLKNSVALNSVVGSSAGWTRQT